MVLSRRAAPALRFSCVATACSHLSGLRPNSRIPAEPVGAALAAKLFAPASHYSADPQPWWCIGKRFRPDGVYSWHCPDGLPRQEQPKAQAPPSGTGCARLPAFRHCAGDDYPAYSLTACEEPCAKRAAFNERRSSTLFRRSPGIGRCTGTRSLSD